MGCAVYKAATTGHSRAFSAGTEPSQRGRGNLPINKALRLDSPRLLGSRPTVLVATLPSNKFYLLYVLPCVWRFFSNPCSDHDIWWPVRGSPGGISFPTSSPHSLGPSVNRQVAVEATEELWPGPHPGVF